MRHLFAPIQSAKMKTSDTTKHWRGCEFTRPIMHHTWEYIRAWPLWETLWHNTPPQSDQLRILYSNNCSPRYIPKTISSTQTTKDTYPNVPVGPGPQGNRRMEFDTAVQKNELKQYGHISWKKKAPENYMHDTITWLMHGTVFINMKTIKVKLNSSMKTCK